MATNFYKAPDFSPQANVHTIRPSSTALLTIDSEDRFQKGYTQERIALTQATALNNSPYDFTIVKNESIMNGYFTRLGLTEIVFPFAIPNINNKTNKMVVNYGPTTAVTSSAVITIGQAWYKPHELAVAVQTAVRNISSFLSAFEFTYAPTNTGNGSGLPSFYYETNGTSNGPYIAFAPMPTGAAYPYPQATTKQLFDLLGFTAANSIAEEVGNGTYTFCEATRYVDIVCSQLVLNQPLKDTTTQSIARDSLCRLYLGDLNGFNNSTLAPSDPSFCPPGCAPTTIYRQFQTPKMINWTPNQPIQGNLRFQVYDDNGAILTEVAAGQGGGVPADYLNWSATILVSEN